MEADLAIRLTTGLAAVSAAISSLEYLTYPKLLADDALASWPVSRTNRHWKLTPTFDATLGRVFVYPNFIAVIAIRFLAANAVIVGWPLPLIVNASVIAVTSALMAQRSPYGTDGADQMTMIIFLAVALAEGVATPGAARMFLWFVTSQACLAYFVAGFAKLISPIWRDGRALSGVLGTTSYGYPQLGPLLARHQGISLLLGWGVIVFECAFPAVLLGIPEVTWTLLAVAFAFHLGTVFLMRLNTFIWAFVATCEWLSGSA
jgi:hypothetical protein